MGRRVVCRRVRYYELVRDGNARCTTYLLIYSYTYLLTYLLPYLLTYSLTTYYCKAQLGAQQERSRRELAR